jgi:hypothetical protein
MKPLEMTVGCGYVLRREHLDIGIKVRGRAPAQERYALQCCSLGK